MLPGKPGEVVMKRFFLGLSALLIISLPAIAQTAPAPAAPTGFSVQTSTIGDLLDHPAAKAVFAKYLPDVVSNPQIDQGRAMTLPEIVQYVPDLTPDKLSAIDAELKALPAE
jgi:para-nitrobenzyl esterase